MGNFEVHESVLVGYFCQAVGWISRDLADEELSKVPLAERYMRAINLSHNPLDPAIGDMILQLDNANNLPEDFYIFEFKVEWQKGVRGEHQKFAEKHGGMALTSDFVFSLTQEFPEAAHAHLYGALAKTASAKHELCSCPYWEAMLTLPEKVPSVMSALANIAHGTANKGFSLERLALYMERLNSQAKSGSMAATGSARFAVAYHDYQLYTFNLESICEYELEKQRHLNLHTDQEPDSYSSDPFSPS
ncbi:hypothetical protein [Massilia phyllosphaerae]|uniref:hypothetical protein n=1 Tax=Massilia phyllosphaerae TaxID=3106034 RepID=UPI002B1CAFA3|nr:hypothetical protein [Massilia sp. SGZ-792]